MLDATSTALAPLPCRGRWHRTGPPHGGARNVIAMSDRHGRTGKRRKKWMGMLVVLAALLLVSAVPGYAWRGGHGFKGGTGSEARCLPKPAHRGPLRAVLGPILGALYLPLWVLL